MSDIDINSDIPAPEGYESPEEAQRMVNRIDAAWVSNPAHVMNNSNDPRNPAAVDAYSQWGRLAHADDDKRPRLEGIKEDAMAEQAEQQSQELSDRYQYASDLQSYGYPGPSPEELEPTGNMATDWTSDETRLMGVGTEFVKSYHGDANWSEAVENLDVEMRRFCRDDRVRQQFRELKDDATPARKRLSLAKEIISHLAARSRTIYGLPARPMGDY